MVVGATAAAVGCGRLLCRSWPNGRDCTLSVSHLPPGTSKWNKIEHRLFCHITQNWRGKPLVSHEVIVNLIANTTTSKGLKVKAELDTSSYPAEPRSAKQKWNGFDCNTQKPSAIGTTQSGHSSAEMIKLFPNGS